MPRPPAVMRPGRATSAAGTGERVPAPVGTVADLDSAYRVGDGPGGGELRRHCGAGDPPGSFLRALVGERSGAESSVHSGRTAVPEREQEPPDVGLG